VRIKW
jgi:hypothetical protein